MTVGRILVEFEKDYTSISSGGFVLDRHHITNCSFSLNNLSLNGWISLKFYDT